MLRLLRPVFTAGLGGPLGSGDQWMSWIGIDDLVDVYYRAILDPQMSGPVNAVAPYPVRNREYAVTLARVLHRPAVLAVPGLGPRLLLGAQGAEEVAEASQRVEPGRLLAAGHPFRYPGLEPALRHVLGRFPTG
jgi:NAD dependent epimerase/dehydratase family enzyme